MIQTRAQFLEKMIAQLEPRILLLREMPDRLSWNIAGALERIIAADRAELATITPAEPVSEQPVAVDPDKVTWKHPVFNDGGRFNPWAGSYADAMLASADVCERIGDHTAAEAYRAHAERGAPPDATEDLPATRTVKRPRSTWSGPNMPPPEPVPFVAGEQMGFAL